MLIFSKSLRILCRRIKVQYWEVMENERTPKIRYILDLLQGRAMEIFADNGRMTDRSCCFFCQFGLILKGPVS